MCAHEKNKLLKIKYKQIKDFYEYIRSWTKDRIFFKGGKRIFFFHFGMKMWMH